MVNQFPNAAGAMQFQPLNMTQQMQPQLNFKPTGNGIVGFNASSQHLKASPGGYTTYTTYSDVGGNPNNNSFYTQGDRVSSVANSNVMRGPTGSVSATTPRSPSENQSVSRLDKKQGDRHISEFKNFIDSLHGEADYHFQENQSMRALIAKLKTDLIHATKEKLLLCFDHSNTSLLGYAFGEWKHEWWELKKLNQRHEFEMQLKRETDKQNAALLQHERELQAQLAQTQQQLMDQQHQFNAELSARDQALMEIEMQIQQKNQEFEGLKAALAKANRFFVTFSEQAASMRDLSDSARAALEEDEEVKRESRFVAVRANFQVCLSGDGKSHITDGKDVVTVKNEFVMDSLHDLLAKVDTRYMPRMIRNPMSPCGGTRQEIMPGGQGPFPVVPPPHQTIISGNTLNNTLDRSIRGQQGTITPTQRPNFIMGTQG